MRTAWVLGIAMVVAGCSLDRTGIGAELDGGSDLDPDAGSLVDGGPIDDGGSLEDGGERDAFVPLDGFVPPDAFVPLDAGPCGVVDTDGDGVFDGCDRCPMGDDRVDADADGQPDACDAWPCGATIPTIPATVSAEEITISGVSIDGRNVAVVRAGTGIPVEFDYFIDDDACPGCVDQIEIGLVPGGRLGCVYDANPGGSGANGTVSRTLPALTAPGLVELRFNLGQNWSCNHEGATGWWSGEPPAAQTFAALCVVP